MAHLRNRLLGHTPDIRRFVVLLALATAAPMIGVPFTRIFRPNAEAVLAIAGLLAFVGGPAHVSLTAWFYTDPVARPHIGAHRVRYIWVPLALIVGTTAIYVVWHGDAPTRWVNFFFSAWLLWHYQRQNWGIHSFISRVTSGEAASRLEELILGLAVVGGFIAGIQVVGFGAETPVAGYASAAFTVGAAVTVTLPVLIAVAVATTPRLRGSLTRMLSLLVTSAFFLPVFIFSDSESAFLTYALAHGMQYVVFMSYVGGSTGSPAAEHALGSGRPGVPTLILCVATLGVLLALTGDVPLLAGLGVAPLFGLSLGITMAHFVVDAGIWRLRDEFPRRYIGAAFPFLGASAR